MTETGPAITRYAFTSGVLRGTHLTLIPPASCTAATTTSRRCRSRGITAVRVAFQRDTRKLGWGIGLVVIALLLLAIAGPLGSFAAARRATWPPARRRDARRCRPSSARSRRWRACCRSPRSLCVIGGGALCALGWMGGPRCSSSACRAPSASTPVRGRDSAAARLRRGAQRAADASKAMKYSDLREFVAQLEATGRPQAHHGARCRRGWR